MAELDISEEQCVFCPYCRAENVDLQDETMDSFLVAREAWKCEECGKRFAVERRPFLIWDGPDGH